MLFNLIKNYVIFIKFLKNIYLFESLKNIIFLFKLYFYYKFKINFFKKIFIYLLSFNLFLFQFSITIIGYFLMKSKFIMIIYKITIF